MTPRLSFIGCGSHATTNLYPTLAYAACTLDSVCDLNRVLAERNGRLFGAQAVYTDALRMLDERRPDGVMLVGPPSLHHQLGLEVLARGIPLFVEKPTAPSLAQAEELVACARRHGTFIMTSYMKRFGTPYRHLRSLIQDGSFQPALASFRYGHWRSDDLGGMLHTMSIHIIDLAIAMFGSVATVHAATVRLPPGTWSVALVLRFHSGVVCQLALDSHMPRIQERIEISGLMEGGSCLAIVDNVQHLEVHRQKENGIDLLAETMSAIEPRFALSDIQVWRPDYAIPNMGQHRLLFQGFVGSVREFVTAVAEGRDCSPGPEEALEAMRVVAAVIERPEGTTTLSSAPASWDRVTTHASVAEPV